MWSSGFIGAELGTRDATADTLLMWRFIAAAAVLGTGWVCFRRRRVRWKVVRGQILIGLLSQGVYLGAIVWAIALGVPLGTTALIAALQPLAAATVAGRVLGEHVRPRQWAGLAIGFAGVAVAVRDDLSNAAGAPAAAYLLPLVGMAGLLLASIAERRTQSTMPLADALPIQVLTSAVVFSAVAVAAGRGAPPADQGFWLAIAWVVGLSTVGGYGFYWLSVHRQGVTRTSSLIYLTPPTTALWGLLMFGQLPTPMTMMGMVISLTGVHAAATQRPLPVPRRGRVDPRPTTPLEPPSER
jgi:drug/metabolite transporter (DMT)-like permease